MTLISNRPISIIYCAIVEIQSMNYKTSYGEICRKTIFVSFYCLSHCYYEDPCRAAVLDSLDESVELDTGLTSGTASSISSSGGLIP
mmetsp:Transcript_56054/g.62679  ORF Transcript_56054/g.62679 Transcript_56054/m.62679 type:complete len:87 (+) Transcript_56054:133-393(+)